jgi:chromosome segregation ATPase
VSVGEAHDLYGLPLERFVPERTALSRALRDDGRREEAARVGKLPKPSIAAWAVNQLVRTQRSAVSDLFEAGDALQKAQDDLLVGRSDGDALREAAERERSAVEALMERARGLLSSEGHELSQATLDRVADTLHAAAVDDEVRQRVQEGCLQKELRHAGLGGAGATVTAGATAPQKRARAGSTADRRRPRQTGGTARERAKRLEAARKAESDARRAAQRAERALKQAEERRDRAATALSEAEDALSEARRQAEERQREHARARQDLDGI